MHEILLLYIILLYIIVNININTTETMLSRSAVTLYTGVAMLCGRPLH